MAGLLSQGKSGGASSHLGMAGCALAPAAALRDATDILGCAGAIPPHCNRNPGSLPRPSTGVRAGGWWIPTASQLPLTCWTMASSWRRMPRWGFPTGRRPGDRISSARMPTPACPRFRRRGAPHRAAQRPDKGACGGNASGPVPSACLPRAGGGDGQPGQALGLAGKGSLGWGRTRICCSSTETTRRIRGHERRPVARMLESHERISSSPFTQSPAWVAGLRFAVCPGQMARNPRIRDGAEQAREKPGLATGTAWMPRRTSG